MMSVSGSLGRWQVVRVHGDLDLATVPGVRQLFADLTRTGHNRLLLDLDGIGFVDSSGIGVLIGAQRRLQQLGGELRVVASKRGIAALFRMTGLSAAIAVYRTMTDAELDLAGADFEDRELGKQHAAPPDGREHGQRVTIRSGRSRSAREELRDQELVTDE